MLDGEKCIPTDDASKAFSDQGKIIGRTEIGETLISTIFLGMDHGFFGEPLLFETMIFGGKHDNYRERYSTYAQAEAGHQIAVDLVKSENN